MRAQADETSARRSFRWSVLNVLVPKAPLYAQVAARDAVIHGRVDLDDLVVLDMQVEVATNAAVGAHGSSDGLIVRSPVPHLAEVELGLELEGVGRAHRDAVPAIHTS